MAVTEKIGDTELSTYGLKLARLDGNLDLPAFKDIMEVHNLESNLRVLDEKNVQIKLIGFYASKAAMGTAILNFNYKIRSALKQVWTFTNHGFAETCVVKNGLQVTPYGANVEIILTLTITS
ncbi:hypothetical protein [Mariniphaga sediminis]|uniref:hypothetical protein n=1 Tax=Mariniphaga sediminis TaxID=1628158 RepID=UPI00356590B4